MKAQRMSVRNREDFVKLCRAREMRNHPTKAETTLWEYLRGTRMRGLHFRRQYLCLGFIVDFYCHALKLVVEVDGAIHDQQREYDKERDEVFHQNGFCVIRLSNSEIATNALEAAKRIERIADSLLVKPNSRQ